MIFKRKPRDVVNWEDAGQIKTELARVRALVPAAEEACAAAETALEACLARRDVLGIGVAAARREAWKPSDDSKVIRDPQNPGQYLNLGADDDDEAKAVLAQRMVLWEAGEAEEQRLRVAVTTANASRGALRGQVRGLQDRLDQLQAPPPPAPDRNRLPGGGVTGLMAAGNDRR